MNRLEISAATALIGAGVYQIHECYIKHAGALSDVRNADADSRETLQRLVDADCLTAGLTLLAGGGLSLATGKVYPVFVALLAFGFVSYYYHSALAAPAVRDYSNDYQEGDTE